MMAASAVRADVFELPSPLLCRSIGSVMRSTGPRIAGIAPAARRGSRLSVGLAPQAGTRVPSAGARRGNRRGEPHSVGRWRRSVCYGLRQGQELHSKCAARLGVRSRLHTPRHVRGHAHRQPAAARHAPHADKLRRELGAYHREVRERMTIVEKKDKIKAAIGHSPDFADSSLAAWWCQTYRPRTVFRVRRA